jgi:hypothetical protein
MLSPLARLFGHSQADALRFSQDNAWLMDLDKEFNNLKEAKVIKIVGKELVEDVFITFKHLIRTQVVEPFSGQRYFGEPLKVPGNDHFSIAKPDSGEAIQHRLLLRFIVEMPAPELAQLPIERELRSRLEVRLRACKDAEVPFRTYHKLTVLFAMSSEFASICFDTVKRGTADRVGKWLHQTILTQGGNERGLGASSETLADDPLVESAMALARDEHADQVDERHLLLALLADRSSGTMSEIGKALGEHGVGLIEVAAKTGRPRQARLGASTVEPLHEGDSI